MSSSRVAVLELFYPGLGAYTIWQNPDGAWSAPTAVSGSDAAGTIAAAPLPTADNAVVIVYLTPTGRQLIARTQEPSGGWSAETVVATVGADDPSLQPAKLLQLPGTDTLAAVTVLDGHISVALRSPATGQWSSQTLPQTSVDIAGPGGVTAAVVPGTQLVQLFYRGPDQSVRTVWQREGGAGNGWTSEVVFGGDAIYDVAAAQVPGTEVLQIFFTDQASGRIRTQWRDANGTWSSQVDLAGAGGTGVIAAPVPGTDVLQLFYQSPGGRVLTQWREPDGSWSAEVDLGGNAGSTLSWIQPPDTDDLLLFYAAGGTTSGVIVRRRDPDGNWTAETNLDGRFVSGSITPVIRWESLPRFP